MGTRDKREQVEIFLHTFIRGYQGPTDVVNILETLTAHIRKFPYFLGLEDKLRWLKCQKTIRRQMYSICKEKEMSDFIPCVQLMIPEHNYCNIQQYPDDFSKLMLLMDLVLCSPKHYSAFKTYCANKPALQKYITEDVFFTDEMIGYVSIFVITFIVQSVYLHLHLGHLLFSLKI